MTNFTNQLNKCAREHMQYIAIYSRYSSTLQNKSSTEDQIRMIKHHVKQQPDWIITNEYQDAAISGADLISRPGIQKLISDAKQKKFDMIVVESLDRLSRDQADIATFYKIMQYNNIKILTLTEGNITELHIAFNGTMNALYLKDLKAKTKRGLQSCIEQGRSAGGLPYGYRIVYKRNNDGTPIHGLREINHTEAVIVRRIFKEFASGRSPRSIANKLNRAQIRGPRGRRWTETTIRGHKTRGTGIINNELYNGRLIWNRLKYQKNIETGKRIPRLNPRDSWVIKEAPELRIINNASWNDTKQRQQDILQDNMHVTAAVQSYHKNNQLNGRRRPVSLLSGKLNCAVCGGRYSLRSAARFVCSNHHNGKHICSNQRTILRHDLEALLLNGLKSHLENNKMIEVAQKAFASTFKLLQSDVATSQTALKAELVQVDKAINALVNAIKAGLLNPSMKTELDRLEIEKNLLSQRLDNQIIENNNYPDDFEKLYFSKLSQLVQCFNHTDAIHIAGEALRSLIHKIVVHPKKARGHVEIQVFGPICTLLKMSEYKNSLQSK